MLDIHEVDTVKAAGEGLLGGEYGQGDQLVKDVF